MAKVPPKAVTAPVEIPPAPSVSGETHAGVLAANSRELVNAASCLLAQCGGVAENLISKIAAGEIRTDDDVERYSRKIRRICSDIEEICTGDVSTLRKEFVPAAWLTQHPHDH